MWMKGDAVACDPMSDAVVSSVEILNEYKKVTFVFGSVYRGLKLCVKKAIDEDWTLLTQYSLDVLGVTAMSVPAFEEWEEESRSRVLANLDAEIFFNDHDEGDKAKFVSADRACESDMGVCGLMTVGEAHNATLNCRPAEEVVLCYYFARAQQWVKYENKKLRVAGPSGVTLEKEVIGDDLVAHMTVSGVDVASDCAHVEVTKDEAFLRALEVSSNDATLTRSDIMAALGNTQYGLSSESGHPLELTFTAPTAFSIAAIWIHAAKQDISPRTVEVYRKEEGAMVLAFRYTTTYAANQAEMSPMSDFNGVSTTWTISIVDTLLAEREEANETLEPFTYFTGLDIISSSGAERSDVDVKFVAAEEDCSAASAMLDHRTGAVMEVARLNACTGVLAPFTVADYSKTYKMCYAQRSAPDGYSEYVAYDELSFAFRYTTVSAAGAATFAMAGVDKALSLTASTGRGDHEGAVRSVRGRVRGVVRVERPFMVENGEVTVRFTKDQDAMRLCVMYGDEEVYEPQRFVMSVGYIEVVAYAAAWTVYEPYVLTVEGRYLNANNRVVDSKQKVEPTAVVDGVATLHFTAGVLEDALLYTVTGAERDDCTEGRRESSGGGRVLVRPAGALALPDGHAVQRGGDYRRGGRDGLAGVPVRGGGVRGEKHLRGGGEAVPEPGLDGGGRVHGALHLPGGAQHDDQHAGDGDGGAARCDHADARERVRGGQRHCGGGPRSGRGRRDPDERDGVGRGAVRERGAATGRGAVLQHGGLRVHEGDDVLLLQVLHGRRGGGADVHR